MGPNTNEYVRQGDALADQGKFEDAVASYRQALRLQPDSFAAHFQLGNVFAAHGKGPEAVAAYLHAVRLQPDHADALAGLGVALAKERSLGEAIATLRRAVQVKPDFAQAHHNLGVALAQRGDLEQAAVSLREAIRLKPDYAEAHFNLGNTLVEMNRRPEAVPAFRRALELRPDYVDALNNLGLALCEQGRSGEAAVLLRQATRLKPGDAEALNNLGMALADQTRFEEAAAAYEQGLRLKPRYAEAHTNLGSTYKEQGRLEEAVACYDYALWLQPDSATAHWNRSLAYLAQGDYERGWAEYEWRWQRKRSRPRPFAQPAWDGKPLEGRTILLHMEQGLGDMIQFVRYAPLVKERGGRVVVECPETLRELFATVAGVDQVVVERSPLPPFDVQAPLMSLPYLLGTRLETVPAEAPYLSAPAELVERWRNRLTQSSAFKVGILWQGNPLHKWDRHRSAPLRQFAPLSAIPGVELVSLQKGDAAAALRAPGGRFRVTELSQAQGPDGSTFAETSAVMKNLDLVITVDTAVAHLAGALALPVWVGLSKIVDWRWLLDRPDTPWYPTMRLFRQETLGRWEPVFASMADELRTLVARRSSSQSVCKADSSSNGRNASEHLPVVLPD
jgi:Flp pilus assembly protein TadD